MINQAKRKAIYLLRLSYKHFLKFMGVKKDKTTRNLFRLFQTAAYAFIAISAAAIFFTILIPLLGGNIEFGVIGDFFGGILNPTLTFITFMGLLVTIVLQNKELKEARKEAKRSADALSEQSNTMLKQSFDQNFFNLLSLHQEIISSIDMYNSTTKATFKGRDCLNNFYKKLLKMHKNNLSKIAFGNTGSSIASVELEELWTAFWKEHEAELNHYFRFLTNILEIVDSSNFKKAEYIRTIKSQLSNQELCLIFYYSLFEQPKKLHKKVTKFGLLENLPTTSLLNPLDKDLYPKSAYKTYN